MNAAGYTARVDVATRLAAVLSEADKRALVDGVPNPSIPPRKLGLE